MNGTTIDLSTEGVQRIIAALTTAGIEVHYHETDEHYVDLHLTPVDADPHTVLSWYQQEGWFLVDRDDDGDSLGRWPFGHVDLAKAVTATKSLLDDDEAEATPHLPALTAPLVAAGWVLDAVTEMSAGSVDHLYLHPSGRQITAVTAPAGEPVELTLSGLTLDQAVGAVVGAGYAPGIEADAPDDYWLQLTSALRRVTGQLATLAGTPDSPDVADLVIHVGRHDNSDPTNTALVDQIAAVLGLARPTSSKVGGGQVVYESRTWGRPLRLAVRTYVPDEDSELARLRAEVAELRAERAGGAR